MFVTMVLAALIIDVVFSALGLIPSVRPTRTDIFGSISVNYKLVLNVAGLVVFAALFGLTARRGAADPVCGMTVDRGKALTTTIDGQTFYFCSEHCRHAFEADPARYRESDGHPSALPVAELHGDHPHAEHEHTHT